jgi:outer membrane receptor for ferrienterochelin and colicin
MLKTYQLFLFGLVLICASSSFSQNFNINGTVVESESKEAIPYVSVLVRLNSSKEMIGGTTTLEDGSFNLTIDSSNVYLEIKFIGFETTIVKQINWNKRNAEIGQIPLKNSTEALEEVEVRAEKSSLEFKLDKRVFNVGKDIASSGSGAMDVLNNVPSVSVDIEGNISLRGSQGVQILIDGKPSILSDDPANALGSITADMIDRVEVITNPSAKYNAEGSSGIINIVLKKEEKKGFNGSVSLNTGYPHNHSVGASLNLRTKKLNFFTQFGVGYRSLPKENKSEIINFQDTTKLVSEGINYRNEIFYNITLGVDYYINKYNTLTISGKFAYEIEQQPSENEFTFYGSQNELTDHYTRTEKTSARNPKWSYELQYEKVFKNHKQHKLEFSTQGRFFGKKKASEFTNSQIIDSPTAINQRMINNFQEGSYTFKLDYNLPIKKTMNFEAGLQYDINNIGNDFAVYEEVGFWQIDSSLTNDFNFDQKVLGAYASFSYEGKKFGVKTGLRVENTDLKTFLLNSNETNKRNFTDIFPTAHVSYKFSKTISMQLGYSRRIYRPRMWSLNPFFSLQNNVNVSSGNPELIPEYGNSTELTSIFIFKKVSLNASLYYLHTSNVTERITTQENGINITKPQNIGVRHKIGIEVNTKVDIAKWMDLNADFNYGYFNRLGEFENQNFDFSGDQYTARLMLKFKTKIGLDFEVSGNYQSREKTVQGEVSGFGFADMGIRYKLWKGKGVINFAIRDIFASRIRETRIEQVNFSSYNFSKRGRFITLGFSYSFGKGEAIVYSGGRR